jgi:hypothetical protein
VRLLARLAAARRDDAQREPRVALAREAWRSRSGSGTRRPSPWPPECQWVATEGPDEHGAR